MLVYQRVSMIGGNTVALELQLNFLVHGLDALLMHYHKNVAVLMPTKCDIFSFRHLANLSTPSLEQWISRFMYRLDIYWFFIVHTYYIL